MPRSSRLAAHRERNGIDPGTGIPVAGAAPPSPPPSAIITKPRAAQLQPKATTQVRAPTLAPAPKALALSAEQRAEAGRKARRDAVMASPHAKGRATTAAGLIGGAPNLSAEEIITALATMPTDEQTMAKVRQQKADAVWDKVYGVTRAAETVAVKSSKQTDANDVWGRIYGRKHA